MNWTSVKDRLPEIPTLSLEERNFEETFYLVHAQYSKDNKFYDLAWITDEGWSSDNHYYRASSDSKSPNPRVTHWMPLEEPQ